jgi:hypothetical protein
MINRITLAVALSLSAVAAYYSIVGLTAIFSGAFWSILIMGTILETAKVITTSWLYKNWRTAPALIRYYLSVAVVVLMFVTSLGIFGFLSKAHIETTSNVGAGIEMVSILDQKIETEKARITSSQRVLTQLDQSVQTLMDAQRVRGENGAIALRNSQKPERDSMSQTIDEATDKLTVLMQEKSVITTEQRKIEVEVGPLKYIAQMIYGEVNDDLMEKAVRYVIMTLIFVFDPLALLLLISANMGLAKEEVPVKRKRGRPRKDLTLLTDRSMIKLSKGSIWKMEE